MLLLWKLLILSLVLLSVVHVIVIIKVVQGTAV
jgi:hypothetical protein